MTNNTVFTILGININRINRDSNVFFFTSTFQHTEILPWVAFVVKWRLENSRWENLKAKKKN